MKQGLQLRLSQQLAMTPQLQQAIRLLQLSTLELQQELQQALESNPLLEQTLLHVQNRTLLLKRRKLLPYQSLKSSPRYTRLTCSSCKISVGVPWAIKCP